MSPPPVTVVDLLDRSAASRPEKGARFAKRGGRWTALTYRDLSDAVELFACGLLARGLRRGDRVAVLAPPSNEWWIANLAAMAVGAVTVPLESTLGAEEATTALRASRARLAVIGSEALWRELEGRRDGFPDVEDVVLVENEKGDQATFRDVTTAGRRWREDHPTGYAGARAVVGPDDTATVLQEISEADGVLTHRALLERVASTREALALDEEDVAVALVPPTHPLELVVELALLTAGGSVNESESEDKAPENVREARPTVLLVSRAFIEEAHAALKGDLDSFPLPRRRIAERAIESASREGPLARVVTAFTGTALSPLRRRLGGRLRAVVPSGGRFDVELKRLLLALGARTVTLPDPASRSTRADEP